MKQLVLSLSLSAIVGCASVQAQPSFGTEDDVAYAQKLWQAMVEAELAGDSAIHGTPYTGQHPHGAILDTVDDADLSVDGNTGAIIVKRNYGGEGVSKEAVADKPGQWLKAVTVMYRRDGYDPDNNNWFWVKYLPDGSLDKNPQGMALAGQVGKGGDKGCIPCHSAAPGGDGVFNNDRFAGM